jgi:TonB-linked SusC/RagA family outer membrane protein
MEFLRPKGWIMKLTCLLVAMGCTGMQLLMANTGKSQELNEVRVSLELKNEPLRTAFTRIEQQTDFRFAYNRQLIDNSGSVTISRGSYTVEKALELMLANTRLLYRRVNNKIIVYRTDDSTAGRTPVEMKALIAAQTGGTIRGKVTNEKGEPVVGASVLLSGIDRGTSVDVSGNYSMTGIKPGNYNIQISAVGYQPVTRSVTVAEGQTLELNYQLKAGNSSLNEVVVTGYSRQSKRDVTGAASTISADAIAQTPVTSVENVLQGRVAGVSVDEQGGPGQSQTIRIRGIGTLGNNDPLYVIDGVQVRVGTANQSQNISNLLDPAEIESITVLKDPSLIAIYGSEGSNGVIVITTKTGKLGGPRLEYNTYVGNEAPIKLPKMITPQQQANALYNSYINSSPTQSPQPTTFYGTGTTPVLPDYIIEGNNANVGVMSGDPAANPALYNLENYRILKANQAGTNWWKLLFKPALTQNNQLSISGATDKSSYAISMGYLDDQGTLLNSYFKRLSLRVNTQFKVKPWLRVGENIDLAYSTSNTESRTGGSNFGSNFNNDIAALYELSPLLPLHDIEGNLAGTKGTTVLGGGNPYTSRFYSTASKNYSQSMLGTAYAEVEPIKGLIYTNQIGFQFEPNEYHYYNPALFQEPLSDTINSFGEGSGYYTDWRWLNKLAYSITINNIHRITAFAGYEARQYVNRNSSATTGNIGYPSSNTEYLGNGNTGSAAYITPTIGGGGDVYTSASEFANVTYAWLDKYLFTATGRRDGSSKFGPEDRYGNFGAISGGWRISGEKFMDKLVWLDDLKLRASYGSTGNDAIASGLYLGTLSSGPFGSYDLAGTNTTSMTGYFPYQLGNPDVHWESNVTTNVGFDAALFNNKLTGSFNWYNKVTKGLLYAPPSPGTAGSALSPIENVMNFTNKGVELEMGYTDHIGPVKFDMAFNVATYRSRVNYIDGVLGDSIAGGYYGSGDHTSLTEVAVGRPVSSFYGYVFQGYYQNAQDVASHPTEAQFGITSSNALGHVKYKDLNGDGMIDTRDETFIGNPNPKFTYGYNLNLYYKGFDLGILLQGVYGNKIYNLARALTMFPNVAIAGQGGLVQGSLDTWSPSNPNAKLPIYSQDLSVNDVSPSSLFVESGSYLRVKQMQLGYTFPKIKGISRLRVYVQAYNVFTITHYSGLDPEVNDGAPSDLGIDYGTAYPISRKFLFGVNLGL